MTVQEVSGNLFAYFRINDTFEMKRDFKKVILLSEDEDKDRKIIEYCLEKFQEVKIVKKIASEKDYWVLEKPMIQYEQNFTVNGQVALDIADVVNTIAELNKDKDAYCDPHNLTIRDFLVVLNVAKMYSNMMKQVSEQVPQDKKERKKI